MQLNTKKNILFISHDASRTGGPIVLLHFLKWLQINRPEINVDLLALRGGNLDNEFKNVVTNYFDYEQITMNQELSLLRRIGLKLKLFKNANKRELFVNQLVNNHYDLVYANTIVSLPFASNLIERSIKSKLIVHVHELNSVIRLFLPKFSEYIFNVNAFITVAETLKDNLVTNWKVPSDKIEVVYECANINENQKEIKSDNFFTIGASGTVDWRKGYDVFIQVARHLCDKQPENNFKFIWTGKISSREQIIIEEDIAKLGLLNKVFFIGELENPNDCYVGFDVFLMTSREDPFPLVCIELGLLGKPIISFDKATGTNEVLKDAGGFIVPYLNIEAMSEKVMDYYETPNLIMKHGALNKIAFSKFTPQEICPQYFKILQNYI